MDGDTPHPKCQPENAPDTWEANDDVCCGLIVSQIEWDWTHCPFCGDSLPFIREEVVLGE